MKKNRFTLFLLLSLTVIQPVRAALNPIVLNNTADATDADTVLSALAQASITPDNPLFAEFNSLGCDAMDKRNYGSAAKFFGENMLRYPSAGLIINYTDARMLMLQQVRQREKNMPRFYSQDLADGVKYYQAAQTVNNKTNSLSEDEKQRLTDKLTCINHYMKNQNRGEFNCIAPGTAH